MIDLYKEAKNIHVVIRAYGQNKMQHASGGVSRVRAIVELLRLGVCDRLDLYGFSSGGGKYFIQRMKVSSRSAMVVASRPADSRSAAAISAGAFSATPRR